MKMRHLFKGLIGRFTGMTEPYPKGEFEVPSAEKVVETLKRARELTEKYGANVLLLNELSMTENEWTPDWPTEPGWYWFYGHMYGEEKRSAGVVRVSKISNGLIHVLDGNFMWPKEGHRGVFQRLPAPVIPAEIAGGELV
jgi:hypothetical protein